MNLPMYILSLDQGTTSSRAIVFNQQADIVAITQKEFTQIYPQPGWVEHKPLEIWSTQASVAAEAVLAAGLQPSQIAAIGITNQRETTVVWDKKNGATHLPRHCVARSGRTASLPAEELKKKKGTGDNT